MWGGDESYPGHLAGEQMLRPPHKTGKSRIGNLDPVRHIKQETSNGGRQRSLLDEVTFFFSF